MNASDRLLAKCSRCGKALVSSPTFVFRPRGSGDAGPGDGPPRAVAKCFTCALVHRPMLRRSAIAALVVGTILTTLNQGDLLLGGQFPPALYWKVPLTYCVPFLVATYGALTNSRV